MWFKVLDYEIICSVLLIYPCLILAAPQGEPEKANVQTRDYVVSCYFDSRAQYRPQGWAFRASNVDPSLCSHIIFAYYIVNNSRLVNGESNDEAQLSTLVRNKLQYPDLKILVAVGGWNAGSVEFSNMVHSSSGRQTFINDCKNLLDRLNLDGIEIDWKYPAMRDGRSTDKQMYTTLLREMRQSFDAANRGWLLTVAQSCGKDKIMQSYEIANIAREVDFINLMSYDFHGPWLNYTGIHPNLYGTEPTLFADWAVDEYIRQGAPANKLVLGVVAYGNSWRLCNPQQTHPGARACGPGGAGQVTNTTGTWAYHEICKHRNWQVTYDYGRVGEYRHNGVEWVGYDTPQSIATKCGYIKSKGLLGGFMWELSLDDFRDACYKGIHPLMKSLNNCFRDFKCPTNMGYYDDITSCKHYWSCSNWRPLRMMCSQNLMWSQTVMSCSWDWSGLCWAE